MTRIHYWLLILYLLCIDVPLRAQLNCSNNWLNNKNTLAGVQIGDLDVVGNTITVEALINSIYAYPGGRLYTGDIVSKHLDASSINYLLRPNSAEITTTNGYFITPPICNIMLNKTYHVAMVYDGRWLKFYRNGFLMSQVSATGNMFLNNFKTMIGEYAVFPSQIPEAFVGYIDEVRIWNTARTQQEIQSFMDKSLPNPQSQTGLLAYYSFNSLKNLQGNTNWDGIIIGNTTIQTSNPTCNNFIVDSCPLPILPVLTKSNDTAICLGQTAILNVNASNTLNYLWSHQAGLSNTTIKNPRASPTVTTKYYISINATDSRGAIITLRDSIMVTVKPLPTITKNKDTGICIGATINLFAAGGINYLWAPATGLSNNSIFNPSASPTTPIVYKISVTGANGCMNFDSVQVQVFPKPNFALYPLIGNVCIGDSIQLTASGGTNYEWSQASGIQNKYFPSVWVKPNVSTSYQIKITDTNCGVIDSLQSKVNVLSLPQVFIAKTNDIDCSNYFAILNASGGSSYTWTPSLGLSDSSIANPRVQIGQTTKYIVKVSGVNGCNAYDSLIVSVSNINQHFYFIPNSFTPNKDGLNDSFGIKDWGVLKKFAFSIYNRWGELIFFTTDPLNRWDGNYKGVPQDSGVFVYSIKAETFCGTIEKNGAVLLIK